MAFGISGLKSFVGKNFGGKKQQDPDLTYNGPKFAMKKTSDFIQNEAPVQIGGPNASSALNRRYQQMRDRVSQDSNAAGDKALGAIQRRFASIGAGGSGAQIKMMTQAQEQAQKQKADAISQVDMAEQQEISNRELAQADMDFKNRVFNFERGSKLHELDLAERGQQISQAQDEYSARLNAFLNKPPKQGLVSNLLGDLL